jgi:hypothetical protein
MGKQKNNDISTYYKERKPSKLTEYITPAGDIAPKNKIYCAPVQILGYQTHRDGKAYQKPG